MILSRIKDEGLIFKKHLTDNFSFATAITISIFVTH